MVYILLILVILIVLFLAGCNSKPAPKPTPEPEPDTEAGWKVFYPVNWYKPLLDTSNHWRKRNYDSEDWQRYEAELDGLRLKTNRKQWDDYTLAQILTSKTEDGRYAFVWTSDMEVWGQEDYWDTPNEALTKRENGLYRLDCDGYSSIHCDFLYRKANYPLVWFTEIYWKKKHPDVDAWKNYGHAITVYKRKWEDNFRAFSNQSWLGMTSGYKRFEDIVLVFVPINKEEFKDKYRITMVKARHPLTGELLFELKNIVI